MLSKLPSATILSQNTSSETSGSAHPHSTGGEAAQPSRGKRNEKSGKPPVTFSKRKTPASEDPHMVVGSGKSINLLFSQREDFKITP
jgi:hypothetical protein